MNRNYWKVEKTEAVAANGMVGTKHPLASQAGLDILKQGGNAIDAAVAAAFAVGVVEPWMNGLGGGGFLVYYSARKQRSRVFDFNVRSPLAAHSEMYPLEDKGATGSEMFGWRAVQEQRNVMGYQAIAVPGTPAGLALALASEGTMSLAEVIQPAIQLATEGFPVDWFTMVQIASDAEAISRYPETARTFFKNGFPLTPGQGPGLPLLKQPALANSLRILATEGVEAFYTGSLARQIVLAMRENGGLITEEDLATYQARIVEDGLLTPYQNVTLIATNPPSGGPTISNIVAALDKANLSQNGHNSVASLHTFAQAARAAFDDRLTNLTPEKPMTVNTASGSTTHLGVIDRDHNMVSLTQTLLSRFGSRVTIPGTGILMNNGMMWFDPEPGHSNSVQGGVRPLANMAPVLLLKEGQPFASVGASGGRRIICTNAQICLNLITYGLNIQDAISAPRIDVSTETLLADTRLPEYVLEGLRQLGQPVKSVEESYQPRQFASPVGIQVDQAAGVLRGGADPFHPATCIGF